MNQFSEYREKDEEVRPITLMGNLVGFSQVRVMPKVEAEKIYGKKAVGRGITSERQTIIKEFLDEINLERLKTKYQPMTPRAVAIKLGMLKTNEELYQFLSECRGYKKRNGSFGKRFFGGHREQKWKE